MIHFHQYRKSRDKQYRFPYGYTAGAAGTGHGINYCFADKQRAYVTNAKIIASIAIDLLADNAANARKIAENREGKLSKDEYIALADALNATVSREVDI